MWSAVPSTRCSQRWWWVPAPGTPTLDSANGDLYFPDIHSGAVSVISGNSGELVATISVGSTPSSPTYDPANGLIYVSNSGSNNVSVISGATNAVVATIPSIPSPAAPLYDPLDQELYVSSDWSAYTGAVCVVSPSSESPVGIIPVGAGPSAPTLDNRTGDLYVDNYLDGGTLGVVTIVTIGGSGTPGASCLPPPDPPPLLHPWPEGSAFSGQPSSDHYRRGRDSRGDRAATRGTRLSPRGVRRRAGSDLLLVRRPRASWSLLRRGGGGPTRYHRP